jgi:hypothetical protein
MRTDRGRMKLLPGSPAPVPHAPPAQRGPKMSK